jgi:hypothetical protein
MSEEELRDAAPTSAIRRTRIVALANSRALSLDCRKCMKVNLDNYFTNTDVLSLVKY